MPGNKQRSLVLAVGAAAIVMAGAYSGAILKTDTEKKQIRQEFMAESNEQKIDRLEAQKTVWMRQRQELAKKIEQLDAKIVAEGAAKDKQP